MSFALRPLLRNAAAVALASVLLSGCIVVPVGHPRYQRQEAYGNAAYPPPATYPAYPAPPQAYEPAYGSRGADIRYGTVTAIEPLGYARGGSSGAGALTGGVIGGVIGHEIGRGMGGPRSGGGTVGAMIGAFGGAVIGDQVERDANRGGPAGYRIWIRFDTGGDQSLQTADPGGLRVGERVRFVNGQLQRGG